MKISQVAKHVFISVGVLVLAASFLFLICKVEPKAEKPTTKTKAVVESKSHKKAKSKTAAAKVYHSMQHVC